MQSWVVLRCVDLTAAAAAEGATLGAGLLWCVVLQAAAAVLALRLPCRSRRLRTGLASVALAATVLGHCMFASCVHLVLAADPGYLFYRISSTVSIFIFVVGDVVSFIALLLGGEDEAEQAASSYLAS